jgi:hypothetical protein
MYVCVLDREGAVLVSKNIAAAPDSLLELIAPYREDLAIAAECMFTWYWLADLCERTGIVFVLGHALYMLLRAARRSSTDDNPRRITRPFFWVMLRPRMVACPNQNSLSRFRLCRTHHTHCYQ